MLFTWLWKWLLFRLLKCQSQLFSELPSPVFLSVADYVEPYVIGLLPRYVEIRTISPRALIQSIELPKPRFITQGKHMYVASTSHVWRLIPVSIPMQIQQLLHDKQFSLALMLAVSHQLFLELDTFMLNQCKSTKCNCVHEANWMHAHCHVLSHI